MNVQGIGPRGLQQPAMVGGNDGDCFDPISSFSDEHTREDDDDEEASDTAIDYDLMGLDSSRADQQRQGGQEQSASDEERNLWQKISSTFRWKVFVGVLIVVNTAVVVVATSLYLNHEEDQELERSFETASSTVSDGAQRNAKALVESLGVFRDVVTSYSLDTVFEFPYVTIPGFENRVAPIREGGMFDVVGFLPLINTAQRKGWEAYSVQAKGWVKESYQAQMPVMRELTPKKDLDQRAEMAHRNKHAVDGEHRKTTSDSLRAKDIYSISGEISMKVAGEYVAHPGDGPYAPIWQLSPPPPPSETALINTDLMSGPTFHNMFDSLLNGRAKAGFVISQVLPYTLYTADHHGGKPENNSQASVPPEAEEGHETISVLLHPIRDTYGNQGDVKAFAMGVLDWKVFFSNLLPDTVVGVDCVLHNPCYDHNHFQTFRIHGRNTTFLGNYDLYEGKHDNAHRTILTEFLSYASSPLSEMGSNNFTAANEDDEQAIKPTQETCKYEIYIHPAPEFYSNMDSNGPMIFTMIIAAVFVGTGLIFLLYIYLIGNRQNKLVKVAMSTAHIVSTLFPSTVRDRILKDAQEEVKLRMSERSDHVKASVRSSRRASLQKMQEERKHQERQRSKPVADLFPEATVLFADIVGFTAWSSVREPTQVFELLETLYHSFDEIAKRRRVFKVETIGDCYVAVAGVPDPARDHAVNLCRFARDCLQVMNILTKKLEVTLGPDTGELSMRFGLHSGPVTAGVLRGERSRFQLFGDTVNTAARMESHGKREKIHISEQTAQKLREAGKEDWFIPRLDKIVAKGKGELQTYWLHAKSSARRSSKNSDALSDLSNSEELSDTFVEEWLDLPTELFDSNRSKMGLGTNEIRQCLSEQNQRLADWNSNQLFSLLKNVVSHRRARAQANKAGNGLNDDDNLHCGVESFHNGSILDEATDMIRMPDYDANVFVKAEHTPASLSEVVQQQLHDYVSIICSMYVDNPFHNYQHASHVIMSVIKNLHCMAVPEEGSFVARNEGRDKNIGERLHSKTFAISSDPLAHFAVAFASLIHDVDHPGVTNKQLVQENSRLARIFNKKSVAEQNSFQCGWDLFMDPSFDRLRAAIYTTEEEFQHFRQLVVNAIVATDLMDQELTDSRNKRWEQAFSSIDGFDPSLPPRDRSYSILQEASPESSLDNRKELQDRRATLVLEYLVQAADIAHTMQHWHVYRKWNEKLYYERVKAHNAGRCEADPSDVWYQEELDFFDNTVIPLARKLKSCGIFGVSFDESLNYALQNRHEWHRKGQELIADMDRAFDTLGMSCLSGRRDSTSGYGLEDDSHQKQQ